MHIFCACVHIYVFVCVYACECKFSFLKLVSMLNISDTCRASPEGGRHLHVKSFNKATYCLDNNNENSFFKKKSSKFPFLSSISLTLSISCSIPLCAKRSENYVIISFYVNPNASNSLCYNELSAMLRFISYHLSYNSDDES